MQVDVRDTSSIPASGRSPGGRHSNPLQYYCLENPVDRGPRQAAVHRVAQNWTWLKRLSKHACMKSLYHNLYQNSNKESKTGELNASKE